MKKELAPDRTHTTRTPPSPWIAASALVIVLLLLLVTYLNVPSSFIEMWAGGDRLPHQSFKVSRIFRLAYGLPALHMPKWGFFTAQLVLNAVLWIAYVLGVWTMRARIPERVFWGLTVTMLALCVLMPPLLSTDVFYYGITGQIASVYHSNPYLSAPENFPQSQLLPLNYWYDFTTPYGPYWTDISAVVALTTGDHPFATAMAFKVFAALCTLGSAVALRLITQRVVPDHSMRATTIFAWSPITLLESGMNAHNDAFVALLAVLSIYFLFIKRRTLGYATLALASLVKLTALPLLVFLYTASACHQRLWRQVCLAALHLGIFVALAFVGFAPWWSGVATFQGLAGQSFQTVQGVLPALAYTIADLLAPAWRSEAATVTSAVALILLGLWSLRQLWLMLRSDEELSVAEESFVWGVFSLGLTFAFVRSYTWYLLPGLLLLAIAWPHHRKAVIALYILAGAWFFAHNAI